MEAIKRLDSITAMAASVAEVTASLVREYLSRKGLKRTIACMDEELPRTESSINNRSSLREILHIEDLYRQNKVKSCPLKTLLEIIVKHQIENQHNKETYYQIESLHSTSSVGLNDTRPWTANINCENAIGSRSTLKELSQSDVTHSSASTDNLSCQPDSKNPKGYDVAKEPEKKSSDPGRNFGNRSNRMRRGMMTGPISNSHQDSNQRKPSRRGDAPQTLFRPEEEDGASVERVTAQTAKSRQSWSEPVALSRENSLGMVPKGKCETKNLTVTTRSCVDYLEVSEMVLDDIDDDGDLPVLSTLSFHASAATQNKGEYPMDQDSASKLKMLLLGSPLKSFSAEWKNQSFTFSESSDLRYGIVQNKGGPCGVLAAVQAYVLKKLLFDCMEIGSTDLERLRPSNPTRRKCLALALAEILWRAREEKHAVVAVNSGRNVFTSTGKYKSDGVLEKLTCFPVDNVSDLQMLLEQHIEQFASGTVGCLLLTVSALLSRSTEKVRQDMDVSTSTLIGAHGYCTQELVNLLLCGRAVSNVFDNDMELESGDGHTTLLRGIKARCNIGLLSLFEHYHICKVGDYLKTPLYPIWVVCSESHFSVLFGLQRELLTSQDSALPEFDLYYYDGLANQEDEIRLTVAPGKESAGCQEADLIPPLDLCIRTRWTNASVSWNGTEPLL
ncbi:probable ubiquitin carboxyl-terminal hydrolase MINDY-4 isoform X1 [Synchiropus splendidus]|uniref:probable ubiquitin carboxyl-terminal hydrolase MINDY-4 isoform X1 n=1 Tax=Synchiropus splendidus TaxID=270530 RepID=UPI00237E45A2|nr:probable ubiquitin carboxyl-terminal hydrolase MINDY-4 isoform X1 [Synchiropus splendidus]